MKQSKLSIFLLPIVCMGLFFLFQVACQSDSSTDDVAQEASTAPNTPGSDVGLQTQQEGMAPPADNTNIPKSSANKFTLELKDATQQNGVRNLISVTIKPNSRGMTLKDFLVTAALSDNDGTTSSSSGKNKNSFVYKGTLDRSSLASIFLTNVNCLGADDTSFAEGKEIAFKIEAKPSPSVSPGAPYTLVVNVEYQGISPHTKARSIELKAPAPSPRKEKRTHPPRRESPPRN